MKELTSDKSAVQPGNAQEARALEQFWQHWDANEFFEAHEVLEDAWRAANGPRKELLRGLIHGAVARYQHGRGNTFGAARQFVRAKVRLGAGAEGAPIEAELRSWTGAFLAQVERDIASSLLQLGTAQREALAELEESLRRNLSATESA